MEFYRKKSGFTLVEVLVAMSIFVAFTAVLIGGYTNLVRAQREANDYRMMYVEARRVFERLSDKFRDSAIDYQSYESPISHGNEGMNFISKDGRKFTVAHVDNEIHFSGADIETEVLNSTDVKVTNFKMFVSPSVDPYLRENVNYPVVQFQPRVTFYAEFERELNNGQIFSMDLQTTVSSRIYNSINVK